MASIYSKNNKLYMSWYDKMDGKRKNKSLNLENTPQNKKIANGYQKKFNEELQKKYEIFKNAGIKKKTIKTAFQHFINNNSVKNIKTIKDYYRFYNKFKEYFNEEKPCTILNKLNVEEWIIKIRGLDQQKNSIFGYYKQLNHFLNHLFEYNYIPVFKINRDVKPKPEIKEKIVFKKEDMDKIMGNLHDKNSNFRTLINLLFYTGLRSSDILTITAENVDIKGGKISYYSPKRKKFREIAFHEGLKEILKERIEEVKTGKLVKYNNVENLGRAIVRYFEAIELGGKGYTARTFRKNFITIARAFGMDASIIRELVGHEHSATADRYYNNITIETMAKELKKFKPIFKHGRQSVRSKKESKTEVQTEVQTEVHFKQT